MKDGIKTHYQIGLISLIPMSTILLLLGMRLDTFCLFAVGFTWCLLLNSPGIVERSFEVRYRLSFLRLVVGFARNVQDAFETFEVTKAKLYSHLLGPLLFSITVAAIVNRPFLIIVTIFGFLFSQLSVYCGRDYLSWREIFNPNVRQEDTKSI